MLFAAPYKWKDANGAVHYSDKPPPTGIKTQQVEIHKEPTPEVKSVAEPKENQAINTKVETVTKTKFDDEYAVPYLTEPGRRSYRNFITTPLHRAYVVCPSGRSTILSSKKIHLLKK